jgi:capsular polysaccharide transport system permease protein
MLKFLNRIKPSTRHLSRWVIVFPMVLLLVYYLLLAESRYASESKVVVKRSSDISAQIGGISIPFLGALSNSGADDVFQVKEFIHSVDLFDRLDKQFDLRKQYQLKGLDIAHMVMPWATKEDYLQFYRNHTEVAFDEKTGILSIRTQGYTPELAQQLNLAVIAESEKFVNELSQRVAREQVEFAAGELQRARQRLDEARDKLLAFQNKKGIIDPMAGAETTSRVIGELQGQLATREVELKALSSVLQAGSTQIVGLKNAIEGIKSQIAIERKKLAAPDGSGMNQVAVAYLDLKAQVDFSIDIYKIALGATEKTRLEVVRKIKTLAIISSPQASERPEYPRRLLMLSAWFFILCMVYGLAKLVIEIVEDHRD